VLGENIVQQIWCFVSISCRVGFGAEQIARWLAERGDIQVRDVHHFLEFFVY